jgi:hypothetical protein
MNEKAMLAKPQRDDNPGIEKEKVWISSFLVF